MQPQFEALKKFLEDHNISFRSMEHEPTHTSRESSAVRGSSLSQGVKAMVCETKQGGMILALIAADRKIDFRKLTALVGSKKLFLADPDKVFEKTGCRIGSVHPFGNLMGIPVLMEKTILENDKVNFNVGLHTMTVRMDPKELRKAINPVVADLVRD